jgi:hypothetical protein
VETVEGGWVGRVEKVDITNIENIAECAPTHLDNRKGNSRNFIGDLCSNKVLFHLAGLQAAPLLSGGALAE